MKKLLLSILIVVFSHASNIWNKQNLYDPITMSYYIPYELWMGIPWDGKKKRTFHKIQNNKQVEGFFLWYHPYIKKHLKVYKQYNNTVQLFTLSPKGITQVYDEKGEVYLNSGIHFPAGFAWKKDKLYNFSQEIWINNKHYIRTTGIQLKSFIFDEKDNFISLSFDFYIDGIFKKTVSIHPIK